MPSRCLAAFTRHPGEPSGYDGHGIHGSDWPQDSDGWLGDWIAQWHGGRISSKIIDGNNHFPWLR